ncbi:MAG: ester cyclase [Chloroflexi bacterium]|nr:ester cyclase [Chloroflexota bacterium]
MSEGTSLLLADLLAAWNRHDANGIAGFYARGYVGTDVADADPRRGPEGARASAARYFNAFPDLHLVAEEIIVQGDRAALVWRARGTQRGPFMNIPATGRSVEFHGVSVLTIAGGKVTHSLSIWDLAGLLRSLGLLPELPRKAGAATKEVI